MPATQMKAALYKISIVIILLCSVLYSPAQSQGSTPGSWSMGINIGTYVYQGDLTSAVAGSWRTASPGLEVSLTKTVINRMSLKYALVLGSLVGDDKKYKAEQEYRGYRRFYYKSRFAELSVSDNFYLHSLTNSTKRFNLYLSAGIGASFMLSKYNSYEQTDWAYFSASKLREHVREDSAIGIPRAFISVPLGLGFNYQLNDRLHLNIEGLYRLSTSDYLDGFSRAGNNSKNDYFYSLSAGLHFSFGRKKEMKSEIILPQPPLPAKPALRPEPVAVAPVEQFIDGDKDGIADSVDKCPQVKGVAMNAGCPDSINLHPVATTVPATVGRMEKAAPKTWTIYFEYDRSSLDGQGFANLDEVIRLMKADMSLKVVFKGHTDMKGTVEANYRLSMGRAKVCADFLASYGVARDRIKLEAYSKLQPAADPSDERLQWKNRRVEVLLMH